MTYQQYRNAKIKGVSVLFGAIAVMTAAACVLVEFL